MSRSSKSRPYLIAATIATEDKDFYNHPGFDPVAIVRAFWQNYTTGEIVSGASTITQQLARMLLLTPEEAAQRTYQRKVREIVLAAEIHPPLFQGRDPRAVPEREQLRQPGLRHRSRRRDLFRHHRRQAQPGPGLLPGRAAPGALGLRYLHQPRRDPAPPEAGAGADVPAEPREKLHQVSNSTQPVCVDAAAATQAAQEIEAYNFQPPSQHLPLPALGQLTSAPCSKASTTRRPSTAPASPSTPPSIPACRTRPQQIVKAADRQPDRPQRPERRAGGHPPHHRRDPGHGRLGRFLQRGHRRAGQHGRWSRASRVLRSSPSPTWPPSKKAGRPPR